MEYPATLGAGKKVGAGGEECLDIGVGKTGVGAAQCTVGVFGNKHSAVCSTGEESRAVCCYTLNGISQASG